MGSSLSKVKKFFGSEQDSEADTRANTKTNAKPIILTPVRRTQSIDSPRGARALSESNTSATSPKKQKIKRNVRHSANQRRPPVAFLTLLSRFRSTGWSKSACFSRNRFQTTKVAEHHQFLDLTKRDILASLKCQRARRSGDIFTHVVMYMMYMWLCI